MALDNAALQKRPGDLFDIKRIPLGLAGDELLQILGNFCHAKHCRDDGPTFGLAERMQGDLGVVRLLTPAMVVTRAVDQEEHDAGSAEALAEQVKERLRGLIDPMRILHCQNEWPLPTHGQEQGPQGFKGLLAAHLWRQSLPYGVIRPA